MKKNAVANLIILLLLLACRKTTPAGTGIRSLTGSNPATQGSLLVKEVDSFVNGASFVTTYQYDAARNLTAILDSGYNTYFFRDSHERITQRIIVQPAAPSDTLSVWYASSTLGIVSYTIEQAGPSFYDSAVYSYNRQQYVVSIANYSLSAQLGSVDSFSYDANENLIQLQFFNAVDNGQLTLNIGYDFQYDNNINPLYSYDDCRLPDEWNTSASPNNPMKQTNIYGDPPLLPSNYVTWTYQYLPDKKPSSSMTGGTAISPGEYSVTTYYYQ